MAAPVNSTFDRNEVARDLGIAAAAGGGKGAINFDMPVVPAQTTVAPDRDINVNELLGLTESTKYPSLQEVANTGYYYRDNYMYEPYTITQSAPQYGIYGLGSPQGGGSNRAEGTITIGDQAFRPVENVDVPGFRAFEPEEGPTQYTPSMAYIYANTPRYVPEPLQNVSVYNTGPLLAASDYVAPENSFGAARFLSDNTLNSLNFGLPGNDTTGSNTESST